MELDPKHLAALHVIRERGGLTPAAAILGTSQPALSRMVADLEIRLGAPLFDRSTRPWLMTTLGDSLAWQGRAIQVAVNRADSAIEQFKGGTDGLIKLGSTPYLSDAVLTPMIGAFQQTAPDIRVDQTHAYMPQLLRRLKRRELDVVVGPVDSMDISTDMKSQRLLAAKNIIACRVDHPLAHRDDLIPGELLNYRWISPPIDSPLQTDMRDVLNLLDQSRIKTAYSGGSLSSVVQLLELSDFLTLLPEYVLNQLTQRYKVVPLTLTLSLPTRSVAMIVNDDEVRSHLLTAFLDFLSQRFQNFQSIAGKQNHDDTS